MLQDLRRIERTPAIETGYTRLRISRPDEPGDYDDGLLSVGTPIMLAAYGSMIFVAVVTFMASRGALLAIAVCAVYMVMYFGVPLVMLRQRNRYDTRWQLDTPARSADVIEVFTGPIRRREALAQMTIVPVCVAVAFASFAVILQFVR